MKCKDCEHLIVEFSDEQHDGHTYCLKYGITEMLFGSHYRKKIDRFECYEDEKEQK